MNILKTLKAKLFYLVFFSLAIVAVPCWQVQSDFSRRIQKCNMQLKAVELLNFVAIYANNVYAKDNKLAAYDKSKMNGAIEFLSEYYEKIASTNLKIKTLFSRSAFTSFQKKKMNESVISEMASTIADRASLFSDSRYGIRILMEVSGESVPSIMTDVLAFRYIIDKNLSDNKIISTPANSLLSQIGNDTRSMVFRIGNVPNSSDFKIVPVIFEKTNRLNSQISRIERLLVQYQQANATKEQIFESIDTFEAILFDVWTSANNNLTEMLKVKKNAIVEDIVYFWSIIGISLVLVIVCVLLISHSIVSGIYSISKIIRLIANGNISNARDAYDDIILKSSQYNEINENVIRLINYMSELIEISKNIANVSNRVNLLLSGMNATKTPLLVSIKDSFAEVNKQIKTDYDFILQEVVKLGECSSIIIEVERNLKNSKKFGGTVKDNIESISNFSGAIFNKLSESKDMLDKLSSTSETLTDVAEKINLLGLNLSIIAQKLGTNSAGVDTLASQVRLVSRQIAVASVDVDSIVTTVSRQVSDIQNDNAKIGEFVEASLNASNEIDLLSGNSWNDISNIGSQVSAVVTSLRSNVSSSFDCDSTIQDIDDVKDSIKDMATIVRKASENVEVLRQKIK